MGKDEEKKAKEKVLEHLGKIKDAETKKSILKEELKKLDPHFLAPPTPAGKPSSTPMRQATTSSGRKDNKGTRVVSKKDLIIENIKIMIFVEKRPISVIPSLNTPYHHEKMLEYICFAPIEDLVEVIREGIDDDDNWERLCLKYFRYQRQLNYSEIFEELKKENDGESEDTTPEDQLKEAQAAVDRKGYETRSFRSKSTNSTLDGDAQTPPS